MLRLDPVTRVRRQIELEPISHFSRTNVAKKPKPVTFTPEKVNDLVPTSIRKPNLLIQGLIRSNVPKGPGHYKK